MLFTAGDHSTACARLLTGALKVTSVDVALTESDVCVFPRSEMGRAVDLHPKLTRALLQRSQADLLQSRELLALSGRRTASAKVAGLLMGLAQAASLSSCHMVREFDLPLTRGEMAGMLGLTIETVSRVITRFERDGVIRRKGARGIELIDPAQLAYAAGG